MSVPTYSELKTLVFDECQINVTTDAPVSDTEFARKYNDSARDVWEMSGGRLKSVASATAWDLAHLSANGTVYGLLTDVAEIEQLYATTVAPRAIVCDNTTASKAVTSAALFGDAGAGLTPVTPGMAVSHATAITDGTLVRSVTSTSALTLTQNAAIATAPTLTFSPTTGPIELDEVGLDEIKFRRANSAGFPTYLAPKLYAKVRSDSNAVDANANLLRVELWPVVTGYYLPMEYMPQWKEIDSATVTTPALNDVEARFAGLWCAYGLAPLVGRADLVPGIAAKMQLRDKVMADRLLSSKVSAKQDA